jgi:hypothetical protein
LHDPSVPPIKSDKNRSNSGIMHHPQAHQFDEKCHARPEHRVLGVALADSAVAYKNLSNKPSGGALS